MGVGKKKDWGLEVQRIRDRLEDDQKSAEEITAKVVNFINRIIRKKIYYKVAKKIALGDDKKAQEMTKDASEAKLIRRKKFKHDKTYHFPIYRWFIDFYYGRHSIHIELQLWGDQEYLLPEKFVVKGKHRNSAIFGGPNTFDGKEQERKGISEDDLETALIIFINDLHLTYGSL